MLNPFKYQSMILPDFKLSFQKKYQGRTQDLIKGGYGSAGQIRAGGGGGGAVARWPGGQGGQLPPQRALKRGRQNDDRGAPAAKQITCFF